MTFTIQEIKEITHGRILQQGSETFVTGIKIDNRKIIPGDLFIPILGEVHDAHKFIPGAIEKGAAAILTMQEDVQAPAGTTVILVSDTTKALQDIAGANRARYRIPVVVVTGSSGKTTTKDLIASVLSVRYNTLKTQGNFNNTIGVPLTLLELNETHEAAVIETGMNHLGEIAQTIQAIDPHIGVITNIGTAHLEHLKTQENILKAKCEALSTLNAEDIAVLNGDDPYLDMITDVSYKTLRVGLNAEDSHLDYKAENVISDANGISFDCHGEHYTFRYPGEHNVRNCLTAVAVGKQLGMTPKEIQTGLDAFIPSGNRMKIQKIHDVTYIDDSYNANPDSMKAALNVLAQLGANAGRRIAVLGDMLEMGEQSPVYHRSIGKYAGSIADILIVVGEIAQNYTEAANLAPECSYYCKDADTALKTLTKIRQPGDCVLIKGSNGVGLKKIFESIRKEENIL